MNIKRIYPGFLISLLCAIPLSADTPNQLLLATKSYYMSKAPFKIHIDMQQIQKSVDATKYSTGTFYLAKGNRYRMNFPNQEVLYDGKWLWSWDKKDNQVVVEEYSPQSSLKLLHDILYGNWDQFTVTNQYPDTLNRLTAVHLKTKDDNQYFKKIVVKVEPDSNQVQFAEYWDFKDNHTIMFFGILKPATPVDTLLFRIDSFSGKELIDLRP
jgi:outer membrane lipoprotein-sorting protein